MLQLRKGSGWGRQLLSIYQHTAETRIQAHNLGGQFSCTLDSFITFPEKDDVLPHLKKTESWERKGSCSSHNLI